MSITVRDAYFSQIPMRICDDCAKEQGGRSPFEHYIATYTTETCYFCGDEKPVSDISDWMWPWQKRRERKE